MTGPAPADGPDEPLEDIYRLRFDERDLENKRVLWGVLVRDFFQQYVDPAGTVLDLGAGSCEFINEVRAARRVAVDLNPATPSFAAPGVEVLVTRSDSMRALLDGSVDTVFTSNFFEHLPTKADLLATLAECRRVTRPGGLIVVLMPNIRYLSGRYWDYLDHHLPLTHLSVGEALELSGYQVERSIPRFLPYTVKDARFPVRPIMVRSYLRLRPAWRVLGRQMLVVARSV
jgi:SAM-dependent methyltransferase